MNYNPFRRTTFKDRREAAGLLAEKLREKFPELLKERPLILAIPRGGVVTGDEIAARLNADLDLIISKKIGAPENPELAIGALMHDGSFYPNEDIIRMLNVSSRYISEQSAEKMREIQRRLERFRGGKEYHIEGRVAILVDDGIATGATVFAAIEWLKNQKLKKLIVAVPVGPRETVSRLRQVVDDVVILHCPLYFSAVGEFYDNFIQVEDDEVVEMMKKYRSL
jgi:predicted phosphoribosyltransferase